MCVSTINKIQLINMNFASNKKKEVRGRIEGDATPIKNHKIGEQATMAPADCNVNARACGQSFIYCIP